MEGFIEMSKKQLNRHAIITQVIDKLITRQRAADVLHLTTRQIDRLKKGYLEQGPAFLIHKNTGRKPSHAIKKEVEEIIIKLKKSPPYINANFKHFQELLKRYENINISYSSLYSILKRAGFTSPLKQKKHAKHPRRQRRLNLGELLQTDATPFEWFGGNKKYTLHAIIDDATNIVTGAYFTDNECLLGYLEIMRQTTLNYGIPQSIYSDKHTIFRSPKTDKLTLAEELNGKKINLTQFGRSLNELGINLIYAHSPQAKGRIERLWVTLQSRLPVELALRNITTIDEANKFLPEYLELLNKTFSVNTDVNNIFVPYTNNYDIDSFLCIKHTRKVDNAGTFSINRACFRILEEGYPIIPKKASITVLISTRKGIRVRYKDRVYETIKYIKPDKLKTMNSSTTKTIKKKLEPHLRHSTDIWKNIWHYESYGLTLDFLYKLFLKKPA